MTESEIAKAQLPPPISNQVNRQPQSTIAPLQQQRQTQNVSNITNVHTTLPSSSTAQSHFLLQPGVRFDPKADALVPIGHINNWESNYQNLVEKFAKMTQDEMIESLDVKGENGKGLSDGFLCGILVDPTNTGKYFACLAVIAEADNWQTLLTSVNILILEFYSHLRQQCRQQLLYIFEELIKLNIRQLDGVLSHFCRALSDGTEFRETCKSAQNFAQCLLANKEWILSLPPRSLLPSVVFALFSRLIADAQNMAANGGNGTTPLTNVDNFRQPLISVCELLVRERFGDLMLMGRDLVLSLMRLVKIPQFVAIWRYLLHHPAELMPKLTGIQQLLIQSPANHILDYRVSVRISRKMAEILKTQNRIFMMGNAPHPNAGIVKAQQQQLQQELARLFDSLKTIHLSGPDSGSIRAEIIRHVWAMLSLKEFNPAFIDARSTLLGWLLKSAKAGVEQQWCKLVFFWEWYGFDPSPPHAHVTADPVFSTIRHLLNNGQLQLCNSLVDFLIKSVQLLYNPLTYFFVNSITNALKTLEMANMQVIALFSHAKMDAQLREQMRQTFPDLFPKRVIPIADNLLEPNAIIDFDAIRGNASSTEPNVIPETPIAQQPLTNGKGGSTTKMIKIEQQLSKLEVKTSLSDGKLAMTEKEDGQPAMKKAKLMAADSLQSTHLKKRIVKKESQDILNTLIANTTATGNISAGQDEPKKRNRIKSIEEGGADNLKALKSNSSQIINKTTLTMSSSSAPTIQQQQPMPSTSTSSSSCEQIVGQLQIVDENEIVQDSEPEESNQNQGMPLSLLLPMVREEFREPLESLERSMKLGQAGEEESIMAMQNLLDTIFDADEIDNEQKEYIGICLVRIFNVYLHQKRYMPEDQSEDNLDNAIEHPLYRFFKVLCHSAEDSESRRSLLAIAVKMRTECPRLGYLYLFFTAIVGREDGLGRCDSLPSAEQMLNTYKEICELMEEDWTKQMVLDLEQCHLNERDLFTYVLIGTLKQLPSGPPEKVIRTICYCADPRMIAQLLSEIVRENIVIFGAVNALQLLTDSLKWNSFEQFTLWQLIQIEPLELDKFLEILPRLNYTQHPEATTAIMVILRNMEPNPGIQVMKNLMRNLLLRPHQKDLFTVDAIKLIIDYEGNISSVADCISKMVKKATNQGDIMAAGSNSNQMGGQSNALKGKTSRVLTVENIFGHLDRLCRHSNGKESQTVENLWKNVLFLDMVSMVRKNSKLNELRSRFDELFTQFDIFAEDADKPSPKGPKSKHSRNAAITAKSSIKSSSTTGLNSRDGTPKKKRRTKMEDESDDDWD